MRLRIPSEQLSLLRAALTRAGTNEIGGQLFGEQLAPSDFRASEMTFQKRPGTFARFFVDLMQAARDAVRFFDRTKHRYTQFNYIGEWHSHPSFEVEPSNTDIGTMLSLFDHPESRGTFAVLMIVRLDGGGIITSRAWVFDPAGDIDEIELEHEV